MATKRRLVLDALPVDRCLSADDLAQTIARKEGVRISRGELVKVLELLRKDDEVEINRRPGGDTYSKMKKPLRRGPPAKPYVVVRSAKKEEEVSNKQKVVALIDDVDTALISLSGKMDRLKEAVSQMDDCNKEELEALRLWKQRFKELIND